MATLRAQIGRPQKSARARARSERRCRCSVASRAASHAYQDVMSYIARARVRARALPAGAPCAFRSRVVAPARTRRPCLAGVGVSNDVTGDQENREPRAGARTSGRRRRRHRTSASQERGLCTIGKGGPPRSPTLTCLAMNTPHARVGGR